MGSSERQKRFVEKLKRSGQYEDYKRRSNEKAKNRRLIRLKEKQATLGNVIKKQAPSLKEKRPRKIRERNQRCPNKPKLEDTANTSTEFECYVCLATFKKINDLKVHLTVEHQQAKRPIYQCPHCSKSTSSREILARHVNKVSEICFSGKINPWSHALFISIFSFTTKARVRIRHRSYTSVPVVMINLCGYLN